jgi:2-polyprenyl-3-methyl-5-hydroxy-6-metoxy-1,4-benzoquinol methylase
VFDTIRKCKGCGLRFVNPLGDYRGENETEEYFLQDYLPLHQSNQENSLAERRAHLDMISRHFSLPARPRLLDVGCALGFMLGEAKAAGWEAVGVETSEFAARYASEHNDCPVYHGTLQHIGFESDSFEVITLMDVIEHVPQPCELIEEVYRVLRPQGVIFLTTPNFGSLFVRLYGRNAYGIGPEEHVTYFQPATIRRLLQTAGFRKTIIGTKDVYAENLRRLIRRHDSVAQSHIKAAFKARSSLGRLRSVINRIFMHVPVGDKLIALAQK